MSIESTELGHTLAAKPVIGRGAPQSSCELVHQIPGLIEIKGYVSDDGERVSIARFGSERLAMFPLARASGGGSGRGQVILPTHWGGGPQGRRGALKTR